jgi:hypothetical protein
MPPLLLAVAALPAGFAVADVTGVRPLGGLVLAALAIAAVVQARAGTARSAAWLGLLLVLFVLSHVLADGLGAWGAVAVVTACAGAGALVLLDGQGSGRPAVH